MSGSYELINQLKSKLTEMGFWELSDSLRPIHLWPSDFYRALNDSDIRKSLPDELTWFFPLQFLILQPHIYHDPLLQALPDKLQIDVDANVQRASNGALLRVGNLWRTYQSAPDIIKL